jgi:hypothetical protein
MGHLGSKTRLHRPNMENLVNTLVVTVLPQSASNFVRMLVYKIARMSSYIGHFGLKTRSQELNIKNLVKNLVATVLIKISLKLV